MYTIEWQKRGLPHAHILVWLKKNNISPNEIDAFISAEFPDEQISECEKTKKLQKNYSFYPLVIFNFVTDTQSRVNEPQDSKFLADD